MTNEETQSSAGDGDGAAASQAKKPAAKKAKGKKSAKKPAAKKAKGKKAGAAAKSTGPRDGSVSAMVVDGIKAGKTRDSIVREVCRKFPDSEFTENGNSFFSWYRWNAVRKGWLTKAQADKTAAKE